MPRIYLRQPLAKIIIHVLTLLIVSHTICPSPILSVLVVGALQARAKNFAARRKLVVNFVAR
jgi:hypothetical protein